MDPASLAAFEQSHRGQPSEVDPNPFTKGRRLQDLDSETLYMVLRAKNSGIQDVVGKLEPHSDITTQFGRQMETRFLHPVFRRDPDIPGQDGEIEPGKWYMQETQVGFIDPVGPTDSIYAIKMGGNRRRKTRRRKVYRKRRTIKRRLR